MTEQDKSIIKAEEMVLNMGPQHPSTHGVLRLKIHTDGEVVSKIEPIMGYLHRCFEKHCENLSYEQVVPFTDRCDYLASMHMNHSYAMSVEKLLDIELPERVEYIRVIVADQGFIDSGLVGNPSNWIECFTDEDGKVNSKKTFPGLGYKYDYNAGLFHMPQPYPSWSLDANFDWNPPKILTARFDGFQNVIQLEGF